MPRLDRVSGAEAIRALQRLGFVVARQRGSHVVLKRSSADGVSGCVVPLHRELAIGTLRGILKQAGVAVEDFQANLA
jgi:predicted RNA binding protein YcfA (HicA-like mRNA interferase family)